MRAVPASQPARGRRPRGVCPAPVEGAAGIYFGNRNGELHASADDGDSWQRLASHLPDVLRVRAVTLG